MTQENRQPYALLLADRLCHPSLYLEHSLPAAAELRRLHARVQELEARLEIDSRHSVDGIEARDCTIKLQDERIAELEAQLAAQRVPLTDERVSLMAHNDDPGDWNDLNFRAAWHKGYLAGARAIERAHGIGEQPCT